MALSRRHGKHPVNVVAATRVGRGGLAPPWRTLALAAAAAALFLLFGPAPEAWVFDRAVIAQGEWWRLLTGHWVHSDLTHAVWDIAALLLIGALCEGRLGRHLPLALLSGSIGVGAWLWWGVPGILYYCGLSGILNALLAFALVRFWRDTGHPVVLLTAVAAVAKIIIEIHGGAALLTQTAWPSVPTAHAAGFLSGLVAASATLRN